MPANPTGANVLCLHGLFAGSWAFENLLPMIAERGYPAHAISYRGHPPNPPLDDIGHASIADFANDAGEVARTLDHPILIGHSLGGLIALMLAGRNLARAAILVSPAPPRGITVFTAELFARTLKQVPALLMSRPLVPNDADMRALVLNCVPTSEQAAILGRFTPDSGRAARQAALGKYKVPARAVRAPLLVAVGDSDRFIPPSVARKVAAKYGAQLRIAPRRGHFFFGEPGWREEMNELLDWIDALPRVIRAPGQQPQDIASTNSRADHRIPSSTITLPPLLT
jgi:pimeloyl-ACP methyl ester carboxylesterase